MNKSLRRAVIATALAVSVLTTLAGPAAALTFKGDGFYARLGPDNGTDVRGLVVGDRQGGDSPRLTVGLLGLVPHVKFTIVGRSIGCGGTPGQGNRLFKIEAMADDGGDAFLTRIMAEWSRLDLRSIWVEWGDGAACQLSLNYTKVEWLFGDSNGDAALGLTKVGAGTLILLVEKRPNGRARLSIVVGGFEGDDDVRIRLVNRQCGKIPTKTLVSYRETDFNFSSFRTTTVPLTQNGLDSARSVRVTKMSNGKTWCGPVSLIIVVV